MQSLILTDYSKTLSDIEHQRISCKRLASERFSNYQSSELRKRYKLFPYIEGEEKEEMSKRLGMTLLQIQDWFSKRRMVERNKRRRF